MEVKIPKKVKFFLWSLCYRSLNTSDTIQRKIPNWSLSPSICRICYGSAKSLDHLSSSARLQGTGGFISYRFLTFRLVSQIVLIVGFLEGYGLEVKKKKAKVLWNCVFRAIMWLIWKERNNRLFEDSFLLLV